MTAGAPTRKRFEAVRQMIADRLENGTPKPAAWKLRAALDRHFHRDWEADWIETSVRFDCARRARPARTVRMLRRLRALRMASGEAARFDVFMAEIEAMLAPDRPTPHGYNRTFSELPSEEIFGKLGQAIAPLAGLGHPAFLFAGSLLGYRRDGKLIGHDDDIDVGLYLGECPRADIAARWKACKQALHVAGLLEEGEDKENRVVLKFKSALPVDVDLFPAWTDGGRFSIFPYSNAELPAEALLPLRGFGQDPLMLPADPDALLAQSYGADWRIPDPLFHLNWPEKKKLFAYLVDHDYTLPRAAPAKAA